MLINVIWGLKTEWILHYNTTHKWNNQADIWQIISEQPLQKINLHLLNMALNEVMVQYWRSVCSVASLFVCRTCEYLLFQVFDFLHRFYFPMLSGSLHWRHVPVVLWAFCLPIGPRANRSVDRDQAVFVINVQSAAIFTRDWRALNIR